MIQRIQTLFLVLAFFGASFAYFLQADIWLKAINLISSVLILGSIMLYKARKRQLKISLFAIILQICSSIVLAIYITNLSGDQPDIWSEKGIEMVYPLGVIVLLILARGYIQKDEKLVKSVDRLR